MKRSRALALHFAACLVAGAPTGVLFAADPPATPSPLLKPTVSWIGNSYPGNKRWVQQDIEAMYVTADGTVFTNVGWDEGGGNVGAYKDGELLGFARHTHGWGAAGGRGIAVNDKYVFIGMAMSNEGGGLRDPATWPEKGKKWFGISRRLRGDFAKAAPFPGGKGGKGDTLKECFLPVIEVDDKTDAPLAGLAANATRVFASDSQGEKIHVFDAETMQPIAVWPVDRAGALAFDPDGALWMLRADDGEKVNFIKLDAEGRTTVEFSMIRPKDPKWSEVIKTPAESQANDSLANYRSPPVTAFAFTPDGRLLINNARANDQPLGLVTVAGSPPVSFGSGIVSRTSRDAPGEFGDMRWNDISALGCDAAGNIYVAHHGSTGGGSTVLESYTPERKLRWRLFGLNFVDMADVDPADDTQVFTKEERFSLDYAQPAGREWSYAAYTVDRFRIPDDPRLHIWSAGTWMRRIAGQRVLFVSDMNGEQLQVYRFDDAKNGAIALPSGLFAKHHIAEKKSPGWPPHQPPKGEWLWRDANGNGSFDADEFTTHEAQDLPAAQGWWVDSKGGVWLATEREGIRYFPSQGLDVKGNPKWDFDTVIAFPKPVEFLEVKRLRYSPDTDTLYLAGTTPEDKNQHWKPSGPVLARYDGWLHGDQKLRWKIVAPYERGAQGHSSCEPMGLDVAGDYLFVPYTGASMALGIATGHIELFRADTGAPVGHFEPSPEVGEIGLQDIRECLRAWRRPDGEYLVFLEDDYKAKIVLYRWRP